MDDDLPRDDGPRSDPKCPITGETVNSEDYYEGMEPDADIHFIVGQGALERDIWLTLGACRLHSFLLENSRWTVNVTARARRCAKCHRGVDLGAFGPHPTHPALEAAIQAQGPNDDVQPGSIRFSVGADELEHGVELAIPGDVLLQLIEDYGVSVRQGADDR
jgi:hypothetical protein